MPEESRQIRVRLPYGNEELEFAIPERHVVDVLRPNPVAIGDEEAEVRRGLAHPIESEPLCTLARGRRDVVILVDDLTRTTPADKIVPLVLEELAAADVPDECVTILMALGTHRPMTDDEIVRKLGPEIPKRVRVLNHDWRTRDGLVNLGESASGIAVWVNRRAVEADLRIAVGSIIPHGAVGWSGGAKMIYPGVAGEKTVQDFHVSANLDPANVAGKLASPVRAEIEAMVEKVGLEFIVNVVATADGAIYRAVCGHYVAAHRAGVPAAREVFGVAAAQQVDVLIVGSHPADLDFWQAAKAVFNTQALVRDRGSLILVTPCPEGVPPEHAGYAEYIGRDPEELASEIREGSVADRLTAAPAVRMGRFRKRIRLGVVSDGLCAEAIAAAKMERFETIRQAVAAKLREYGPGTAISVVTHGGETFPYLPDRRRVIRR